MNTTDMWLIYKDDEGNLHYQYWLDLLEVGTLIDEETGDEWDLIGWDVHVKTLDKRTIGSK